jgi:hypothetical protein
MNFETWWIEFIANNLLWAIKNPTWGDAKAIAKLAWDNGAHEEWKKGIK